MEIFIYRYAWTLSTLHKKLRRIGFKAARRKQDDERIYDKVFWRRGVRLGVIPLNGRVNQIRVKATDNKMLNRILQKIGAKEYRSPLGL